MVVFIIFFHPGRRKPAFLPLLVRIICFFQGKAESPEFIDFTIKLFYLLGVAFRIIVDGYNFIGASVGLQGNIEGRRERLISELSEYQRQKGFPITVVFDGWKSGWADEHGENRMGVEVVFSRQGEKADAVVVRMARELGGGGLVVSSDGEVVRQAQAAGAVAVSSQEFQRRLSRTLRTGPTAADPGDVPEEDYPPPPKKKGNPRKLSKRERKKRMRLNKL